MGVVQRVAFAYNSQDHLRYSRRFLPSIDEMLGSSPTSIKLDMVVHVCVSRSEEIAAEESGVQGHPQLRSKFEAILGYTRPCHKNKQVKAGVEITGNYV